MDVHARRHFQYRAAIIQAGLQIQNAQMAIMRRERAEERRRARQQRRVWCRDWLGGVRRRQFGLATGCYFSLRSFLDFFSFFTPNLVMYVISQSDFSTAALSYYYGTCKVLLSFLRYILVRNKLKLRHRQEFCGKFKN